MRSLCLFLLLACATTDEEAELADDDSSAPLCPTLNAGDDWSWSGACPQMLTPCDLVANGCSFEIDYTADGGMTMGMPYAGTVNADGTVTFTDGDSVTGCSGTLEDADTITGTCTLRGEPCTFTLAR